VRRPPAFDWHKDFRNDERRFATLVKFMEKLSINVTEKETIDYLVGTAPTAGTLWRSSLANGYRHGAARTYLRCRPCS